MCHYYQGWSIDESLLSPYTSLFVTNVDYLRESGYEPLYETLSRGSHCEILKCSSKGMNRVVVIHWRHHWFNEMYSAIA